MIKTKEKKLVAKEALFFVKSGMTIGLGEGSTIKIFIKELAKKVKFENLKIKIIPVNENIKKICKKYKLKISKKDKPNISFDGADKIDKNFNVLKGFGGYAFEKEKKLDYQAEKTILLADSRKFIDDIKDYPILIKSVKKPKAPYIKHSSRVFGEFYKIWIKSKKIKTKDLEDKLEKYWCSGLFTKLPNLIVVGYNKQLKKTFIKPKNSFLQIAVDIAQEKKALNLINKTTENIDIIELGTPLIKENGLKIIKKIQKYKKIIMADIKTADTGKFEADLAFKEGADIVSVLGGSADETIEGAVEIANQKNKKVLVDLIDVKKSDREKRLKEILKLKNLPHIICIHIAIDVQKKDKFSNLKKMIKLCNEKKVLTALAGGINEKKLKKLQEYNADIITIGGAITKDKNPKRVSKKLRDILKN